MQTLKPFLKWVGGKRQLLPVLLESIPTDFNNYHELFLGGGALLFELRPEVAYVSDINKDLINCYITIKEDVNTLIELLIEHKSKHSKEYFYTIRGLDRGLLELSPVERAARFIYLNKTCYNGLYRVNSKGQLNTPIGKYKNPDIVNEDGLRRIHEYFNQSNIRVEVKSIDCCRVINRIREKDFVYLDPPYDPISDTASFTRYAANGFNREDQKGVKLLMDELTIKGVYVLVSNSDTEFIRDLYKGYSIIGIKARRTVNSLASKRGEVLELLISNY